MRMPCLGAPFAEYVPKKPPGIVTGYSTPADYATCRPSTSTKASARQEAWRGVQYTALRAPLHVESSSDVNAPAP